MENVDAVFIWKLADLWNNQGFLILERICRTVSERKLTKRKPTKPVRILYMRDAAAVERLLLRTPKHWAFHPISETSGLIDLERRLAQLAEIAEAAGGFAALVGSIGCDPLRKFLIIRSLDLPHFVVSAYERMAQLEEIALPFRDGGIFE